MDGDTARSSYIRASFGERVMFGFEGFTAVLIIGTMLLFFQPFCTGVLGLDAAVPGMIYAAIMVLDAFTDPLFGVIVDKYSLIKTRKYTPWYYAGVILLCAGAVGVFWHPAGKPVKFMTIFVLAFYALQTFGNTFITVSIGPLRNIITNDPAQRSTLPAFSSLPAILGSLLVAAIPAMVKILDSTGAPYRWLLIAFSVLALLAGLLVVSSMGKKDAAAAGERGAGVTLGEMWNEMKSNRPLQMLLIADTTNTFAASMAASSAIYFFRYVIGDLDLRIQPVVSVIGIFTGLAGAFVAAAAAKRWGRKNAYILGTWIAIGIAAVMLVLRPFRNLAVFVPIAALGSIFGGLVGNTKWVMIADCVDYGYWKSGKYIPAVYNSIFSFISKLSLALAGVFIAAILSAAGFIDNNSLDQPAKVIMALLIVQYAGPLLGHIASILSMRYYDIDMELYRRMTAEIASRKDAAGEN